MNEHKRVKMGMMPGDYSKRAKIAMMEAANSAFASFGPYVVSLSKAAKSFKSMIRRKERARMKERFRNTPTE